MNRGEIITRFRGANKDMPKSRIDDPVVQGWCEEGDKLWMEGWKLWKEAIIKYYGKDAKVRWRTWNKDNEPVCHVNGDVYV